MPDFLRWIPVIPVAVEQGIVISLFAVSLAAAFIALLLNRPSSRDDDDQPSDFGVIFENPASIMPHVIELRNRLIHSVAAIALAAFASGVLIDQVLIVLAEPVGGLDNLQLIRVTEGFGVLFRISLILGLILASPYVIAQIWIFVAEGLKSAERRLFYFLFPFALILFLSGVTFAYVVMLPVAVPFLIELLGLNATPTLDDYVDFVTNVLLWVGVSFEMPLIMFVLARFKVVTPEMLVKNWRIAIIGIAILAAVVTPTPDPINMGIVAAPLMVLYVISILLAAIANPRRNRIEEPE